LKHFIKDCWQNNLLSNVKHGLKYLERADVDVDGDGVYNFTQILKLQNQYPIIFSPLYHIQNQFINLTFGEYWWENHKSNLKQLIMKQREMELYTLKLKRNADAKAIEMLNNELVIKRLGKFKYYCFPWLRKKEREKLRKIAAIENDIDYSILFILLIFLYLTLHNLEKCFNFF
jgi:hypothetical protein